MKEIDIFQLIHITEKINNENIVAFRKAFPHDIGISPILVLSILHHDGPQKQVDLADELGYTKGAMTNIAGQLAGLEYVVKVPSTKDRRVTKLDITKKGKDVLKSAQKVGSDIFIKRLANLTKDEQEQYFSIQEKLLMSN